MAVNINKFTNPLWNEWKEKVKDRKIPDRWSWTHIWENFRGLRDLPDLSLQEENCLEDILTCQSCSQVMEVPCTLRCGCSSCNSCLTIDAEDVNVDYTCSVCSKKFFVNLKDLKVNVVLSNFQNKWFVDCSKALKLSKNGWKAFKNKGFDAALQCFDEAVKLYAGSYALWKDRATILCEIGRREEALESIERACCTASHIHEVYYEKGRMLYMLGKTWEAAVALMISAVANKEDGKVTEMLNNVMMDIALDSRSDERTGIGNGTMSSSSTSPYTPLQHVLEKVADEIKDLNS